MQIRPSTLNHYFSKGDMFYMNRVEERPKEACILHSHEFVELCYVHSGCGIHLVGDKEYAATKGDLFIINHEIPHVFFKEGNNTLMTYNMMFKPAFFDGMLIHFNDFGSLALSYLFRNICEENPAQENIRLNTLEQNEFEPLMDQIFMEYSRKQEGYTQVIRAYMILLITKMMRCIKNRLLKDPQTSDNTCVIHEVIHHLQNNYSDAVSLNELAMKSFYSKNYLCTLFKEVTGTTISQYVQNLRVQKACVLLETTRYKISDIAHKAGFSDYKAFSTAFKKNTGLTPNIYRKNSRQLTVSGVPVQAPDDNEPS